MGFYSSNSSKEPEKDRIVLSPQQKEEYVASLYQACFSLWLSELYSAAESCNVVPDLLQKAKEINDEKSDYILRSHELMSELEQLVANDDDRNFSNFLAVNSQFVLNFPLGELFMLLCSWGCAVRCVKALLESHLASHVDVNRCAPRSCTAPLNFAARWLSLPLTRTLLQFGADVHINYEHTPPLYTAIIALRRHKFLNLDPLKITKQDIKELFYKLSSENLEEAFCTIYLLAEFASSDVERMLKPFVYGIGIYCNWVDLALLLVIALPLILCPTDDAWSVNNTPVSRVLSRPDFAETEKKDKAWIAVKSVWEASQYLCKMFLHSKVTQPSGVKDGPPLVMREYFQRYTDAHLFEGPLLKREKREESSSSCIGGRSPYPLATLLKRQRQEACSSICIGGPSTWVM